MTPSALLDEILRLPPAERIKLVEEIWDSIAASPENVPLPQSHIEELDRRLADPSERGNGSTWEEVKARLKSKP